MNPIIKNVLAVIAGAIIGMAVNMGIILLFGYIIPPPEGVDVSNVESIKASMHLYEIKHFIPPLLAHGLGTLIGALVTYLLASNNKMKLALLIGVFFLIGGIMMVIQLPSPTWMIIVDLVGMYIPMAWLGAKLVEGWSND